MPSAWYRITLAVCVALDTPLAAQQSQFAPPEPPCNIKEGHFLVKGASVYLHVAGEPRHADQRDKNLREAHRVLTEALTSGRQTQNPAAWYYLGRYYTEVSDAAGGDSAFRAAERLAPECTKDIDGHRRRLWTGVMNNGFRTWQDGKEDSALIAFRAALALLPSNPRPLFQLGLLFAGRQAPESAMAYLRRGADVAGNDTAFAKERREALLTIGRLSLQQAAADVTVQRWLRVPGSRDSLERALANDSTVLARMEASAASRRARGATLAPADQRLFSRDSAARAQGLAQGRAGRAALAQRALADSSAAQAVVAPGIAALRGYLSAYPAIREPVVNLATLYGLSGRAAEAGTVFDSVFAGAADLEPSVMLDVGDRLVRGNLLGPGMRALERGLAKHPYQRNALLTVANGSVGLRDTARALDAARRLVALDPLNRTSLRLCAAAWDLAGRHDSAQRYRALADSLPVELSVTGVLADAGGFTLTATAVNLRNAPSPPLSVRFEFLDPQGAVKASHTADVPTLAPATAHEFAVRVDSLGVLAWRYRP